MREFFLKILKVSLKMLSAWTLLKYRPGIIGVTGSAGKTSTKIAIAAVLGNERRVRFSEGNFNNEIGLPLTILGNWKKVGGIFFWLRVFCGSIFRLIFKTKYPEILILEYGIDRPNDMKYLLEIAKPDIGIITALGDTPVHVEFFSSPKELGREKGRLIECLPPGGVAILNFDDPNVMELRERTRAHLMTYGFKDGSTVKLKNYSVKTDKGKPLGINFKIEYGGNAVQVFMPGVFGKPHVYAAGAAANVGLVFGIHLPKIAEYLEKYKPISQRAELLEGINDSYVLDDSYNASPLSMISALQTLKDLPAKRRVAVLGDMRELGEYTVPAHEKVGKTAAKLVNLLITVGPRARNIAEAAKSAGLSTRSIRSFEDADEAKKFVKDSLRKGDLVLVKASNAVGLKKIVEEIKIDNK